MQLHWNLFMRRIMTDDETWLHDYDPETKQQTMQWKHASSPNPPKFKMQASAGKMHSYLDTKGIQFLIDYTQHKVTLTGAYL